MGVARARAAGLTSLITPLASQQCLQAGFGPLGVHLCMDVGHTQIEGWLKFCYCASFAILPPALGALGHYSQHMCCLLCCPGGYCAQQTLVRVSIFWQINSHLPPQVIDEIVHIEEPAMIPAQEAATLVAVQEAGLVERTVTIPPSTMGGTAIKDLSVLQLLN